MRSCFLITSKIHVIFSFNGLIQISLFSRHDEHFASINGVNVRLRSTHSVFEHNKEVNQCKRWKGLLTPMLSEWHNNRYRMLWFSLPTIGFIFAHVMDNFFAQRLNLIQIYVLSFSLGQLAVWKTVIILFLLLSTNCNTKPMNVNVLMRYTYFSVNVFEHNKTN